MYELAEADPLQQPQDPLGLRARERIEDRRFRLAAPGVVLLFILFEAWVIFGWGGPKATQTFDNLALVASPLIAAIACVHAARRATGGARRAWGLLGASSLAWMLGQSVWSYYELALGREVPFPSAADIGYLAMVPLAAAAMLSFPTRRTSLALQVHTLLDGLIIGGSLLFVSWTLLLGPLYQAGSETFVEGAIGLAYPAGDVVLIGIVLFIAARAGGKGRLPLALVGGGLACLAVADSGFAYLTLIEAYSTGNAIDVGWFAGFLLIALAALRSRVSEESDGTAERNTPTRLGTFLPFLAVSVCIAFGAVKQIKEGNLEPFLFWNILTVTVLVVSRQLITLLENLSLTNTLETKVQERTAELRNAVRQIAQAKKLQDAFISSVSHELRTPLTTMTGAAATLLRPELNAGPEVRALAEMYARSTNQMSRLVEDLLIATGIGEEVQCARSPFDLGTTCLPALRGFAPKGKALSVQIPDMLTAVGDGDRLPIVLSHLLSNADKFAPDGTTITVEATDHDGRVELTVADEGPGIPPDLRGAVFDRFYQVDGSLTRERGGMGLGLFIARRLTEAMGGRLAVGDSPSGGAAFRIALPAVSRDRRVPGDGSTPHSAVAPIG